MEGGSKQDAGKPRIGLLSSKWIYGVSQVMTFGAIKYKEDHNWRKGLKFSRLYDAAQRHLTAWNDNETLDPETKLSHLLHASCCLMMLYEMSQTKPELDDRYNIETTKE